MNKITDDNTEILMAWRGGSVDNDDTSESSIELVWDFKDDDYIKIKNCDKKIVGKSDLTFLFNDLINNGIECFYGPNFESNFIENSEFIKEEIEYMLKAFFETEFLLNFDQEKRGKHSEIWTFSSGKSEGRIIGGNLDTIYTAMEKYPEAVPKRLEGDIIFLEERKTEYWVVSEEKVQGNTRYKLNVLKQNGFFDKINGIVFGKSEMPTQHITMKGEADCYKEEKDFLYKILKELDLLKVPVIANVPCSHSHPMVTIPLGRTITLDADKKIIKVHKK